MYIFWSDASVSLCLTAFTSSQKHLSVSACVWFVSDVSTYNHAPVEKSDFHYNMYMQCTVKQCILETEFNLILG